MSLCQMALHVIMMSPVFQSFTTQKRRALFMRNQDTFANDNILTLFCSCYKIHVFINRSLAVVKHEFCEPYTQILVSTVVEAR